MDWGGTDILTFYDNYNPIVDSPFEPLVNYHMIYPTSQEEIYFPVAGDYSPIILLSESGIAEYDPISYRYDQIRIYVASETEVESLNIDEVNLRFTIAVFVFSWIGYIVLVYELWNNVGKKKDEYQIAINVNTSPDISKPPPLTKTKKTINLQENSKLTTNKNETKEKMTEKKRANKKQT